MLFAIVIALVALLFEYINGFHDAANVIATSVSTKVLTPRQAILLASAGNLTGALIGVAVATTIGRGLIETQYITPPVIFCGLLSAILWNLLTWWLGLPSSSSHALIGGLCGAALAQAQGCFQAVRWFVINAGTGQMEGILPKVVLPMFIAPLLGIVGGLILMGLLQSLLQKLTPRLINRVFGKIQILSAAWMGFSHGTNDAQKTMGILALILFTATQAGSFDNLPVGIHFLYTPVFKVALWIKILCALTMAAGTAAGGWRIIRTLGHKLVRLQPVHGFAAQTTAAAIIQLASHWGMPLSTTHVISTSIVGVGMVKQGKAVKWEVVKKIIWAWILTLPITALLAAGLLRLLAASLPA